MLLTLFSMIFASFCDRWGGGGFSFISSKFPAILQQGILPVRRFGLPAFLLVRHGWSYQHLAGAALLSLVLSFNNKDIEERKWEDIFLHGFALGASVYILGAPWYWPLVVSGVWVGGVFLSNIGLFGKKLGWHWVELARGATLGR